MRISSKNNPIFKHLAKLISSSSYRYECKSAVITGDILINEISSILPIKTILSEQELSLKSEKSFLVDKQILKNISKLPSIQGPIAEISLPAFTSLSKCSKIAILDKITDPGNMGTLIRSALAFGLDGIHITKGSCDPFNDKVIRSSKGAVFKLSISYEPFTKLDISNFHLLLADMEGAAAHKISYNHKSIAILLSNETVGLDSKWKGEKVNIEISPKIESLNVAGAGTVLFYELAKQCHIRDNSHHGE